MFKQATKPDSAQHAKLHSTAPDGAREQRSAASSAWTHALDAIPLQAKLTINQPGDAYEQEADKLAEQVMRMPAPGVQRMCACGGAAGPDGECEACKARRLGVQRTSDAAAGMHAPTSVHETIRTPGQPLDVRTRGFMESRFGHDFSGVRVHTNAKAAESAKAISAHAYTVGQNVVFADGRYAPGTDAGKMLIAHELTHVVQQNMSQPSGGSFQPESMSGGFDQNAHRVAANDHVLDRSALCPSMFRLQRQDSNVDAGTLAAGGGDPSLLPILPGYSQEGDTCGAASLVTALIIWDRQHRDPAAPNDRVVTACNLILTHLAQRRQATIDGWNRRGRNGELIYGTVRSEITRIRDAARAPGAVVPEGDYRSIGIALYALWVDGGSGLSAADIGNLQSMLGLATQTSTSVQSFAEIFASSVLRSLQPDQIAQVGWYVRTGSSGQQARYGHHAFLIGRLQTGRWFLSDQGTRPASQFTAASLDELRDTINTAARTGSYWLFTGSIADFQILMVGGWTGVRLLGSSQGTEQQAERLIRPDTFLGEVDAGMMTIGDRLTTREFIARRYTLADAEAQLTGAGGGVIVEMPQGVFSLYRTTSVRDANLAVTGLDTGDSAGGLLMTHSFFHAWLILGTAGGRHGSSLAIY